MEDVILKIFAKRSQRGQGYATAGPDVTYFDTAANRHGWPGPSPAPWPTAAYTPEPVDLWVLETRVNNVAPTCLSSPTTWSGRRCTSF